MRNVVIRPLSRDDLPAVAEVHCAAFLDSALAAVGVEAVRRYYAWQLDGPHDVVAFTTTVDGQICGFCFGGIFRGALSGFVRVNRWFLLRHFAARPWLFLERRVRRRLGTGVRAVRNARKRPQVPPSEGSVDEKPGPGVAFAILSLAVAPEAQGQGLGTLLLDALEDAARARGFESMRLTVRLENERAISVYLKNGWQKAGWAGLMVKEIRSGSASRPPPRRHQRA